MGFDPHTDHRTTRTYARPSATREVAARICSALLGASALYLGIVGVLGIYYAATSDNTIGGRMALFVFLGVLPLTLTMELWSRGRPALARVIAGGPVPVRMAGDLTWPLCYRYVNRKSYGGGSYGPGGDFGGGGGGDGGGGGA